MRVRVVKPLTGVVDGVSLASLVQGYVYDLAEHTAEHLIELRGARRVRSIDPPTIPDVEDVDIA